MHRRDLLNLFFSPGFKEGPAQPDPVLITPYYLIKDETAYTVTERTIAPETKTFVLEISTEYAFTLRLYFKSADLDSALLAAGIKNGMSAEIHLGLEEGRLFLGSSKSDKIITKENLALGVELILNVNPLPDGKTYAKLKVADRFGLTLSIVKSKQFSISDWKGELHPQKHFVSLRTEGYSPVK